MKKCEENEYLSPNLGKIIKVDHRWNILKDVEPEIGKAVLFASEYLDKYFIGCLIKYPHNIELISLNEGTNIPIKETIKWKEL